MFHRLYEKCIDSIGFKAKQRLTVDTGLYPKLISRTLAPKTFNKYLFYNK